MFEHIYFFDTFKDTFIRQHMFHTNEELNNNKNINPRKKPQHNK